MSADNLPVQPPNTLSQIIITPLEPPQRDTVALANVTVDDTITINGIALREKKNGNGLYVRMPAKRTTDGTYIDVAHPFSSEVRQALNEKLIDMYETGEFTYIDNATQNKRYSPQIKVVNCSKYNSGNSFLARADLVVSSFVVHNVKLRNTESGNLTINMPAYLLSTGEYRSIVVPKSKNAFLQLNQAYINEYSTDYSYKKATEENIKQLKSAGVNFQLARTTSGDNLIKFKTADSDKVTQAINKPPVSAPKIIG